MILNRLSIVNYKNIAQAELLLSNKVNCFIGRNGQGKTNLLDAIYFLSLCKSATTYIDSAVILHNQDMMALQGDYLREDGSTEQIHCGLKRGQKKILRRGQKVYKRLAEHIGLLPLVMVSPADQLLIGGGSEYRRKFLDLLISQTNATYLDSLVRYNKALASRNAMLKTENEQDDTLLSLLEEEMAHHGEIIYACRKACVESFIPLFQHYYARISQQREMVSLNYISHCQRGSLLEVIRRDRHKDQAVGYSLHGIHRDDLEMSLGGYPIRVEGSQGQNKSFLIALKLAQFDSLCQTCTTTPLLLLDDIFDKLDAGRVEEIVRLVSDNHFGQIFITDTNREHLDQILSRSDGDYRLFHVEEGKIDQ